MKELSCNHHVKSFTREDAIEPGEFDEAISDSPVGFVPGEYTFHYRYPLSNDASFKHQITAEMSWIDIMLLGRQDYERIYKEEDEAVGDPGHIPGMLNRKSSEGPYGIWGHDLSDLYFETVYVDEEKFTVSFDIGS